MGRGADKQVIRLTTIDWVDEADITVDGIIEPFLTHTISQSVSREGEPLSACCDVSASIPS